MSDVAVCVTHKRFVPCRRDDGCQISTDPAQVAVVRIWQQLGIGTQPMTDEDWADTEA